MKIRQLSFVRHPYLGDFELSFVGANGKAADTIIFAGENGTGKTALLEAIANLADYDSVGGRSSAVTKVTLELGEEDVAPLLADINKFLTQVGGEPLANLPRIIELTHDDSKEGWQKFSIWLSGRSASAINLMDHFLANGEYRKNFIRTVFSPVEINFSGGRITNVTTRDLDTAHEVAIKASARLPADVAQLLVDIQALDDAVIAEWVRENPGKSPPDELVDQRVSRFRRAFRSMFPNKIYRGIRTYESAKEPIFEESGRITTLNQLSSGEKQIVFRGSFLLANQKKLSGALVLVDEPEISLHPNWQLKVLQYYRDMFRDEKGVQTCQMFFATHSPFIVHSLVDEHVIVLKRDSAGSVKQVKDAEFPNFAPATIVEKAFDFHYVVPSIDRPVIVFVEGESDKEIIETAWEKLFADTPRRFEIVTAYASSLIRTMLARGDVFRESKSKHFVGLFDFDSAYNEWKSLKWDIVEADPLKGLLKRHQTEKGAAMLLPVPASRSTFASEQLGGLSTLSIEFLFEDTELPPHYLNEKPLPQSTATLKVFKDGRKTEFAERVKGFSVASFENFRGLLSILNQIGL